MGVEFRDIPGAFERRVGTNGTVLELAFRERCAVWIKCKTHFNAKGYVMVSMKRGDKSRPWPVHCLVLETFIGPRPAGKESCHRNGKKADNRLSNLRWDTRENNRADNHRLGVYPRGRDNAASKLTEDQVREILRLRRDGLTLGAIAVRFGVKTPCIFKIVSGQRWRHLSRHTLLEQERAA